jgi:drug/metabolite transporter (DMT)-like permease
MAGMAGTDRAPSAVVLPDRRTGVLLGVAVAAVSTSGPIIAACTAPALAIAFWRCFLGSGATGLYLLLRRRRGVLPAGPAQWRASAVAGGWLALHFAAWIPSLSFTSVASATALVATQPVWAAMLAQRRGARVAPAVWLGIAIALLGVGVLTGIDFALDPRSLVGNGLALVGAVTAAAYVSAGERVRRVVGAAGYTTVCYAVAAGALLVAVLVGRVPLTGFSLRDWGLILALTVLAQLLGHSLINVVLGSASATVTSLAILFELPGAVLIAALWLGLVPPLAVLPALLLIAAGLVVVIRAADLAEPTEDPAG